MTTPRRSMLARLAGALYPFVQQNDVSDAVLTGPAAVLGDVDSTLDILYAGGRYLEPGTVSVAQGSNVITQVPDAGAAYVDWTTRFKIGDEILLGGSLHGQQGRYVLTGVSAHTATVDLSGGFGAAETELRYAKSTFGLWRLAQGLMLYPGGYETDTDLRTNVLGQWTTILRARGTRGGVRAEVTRMTNAPAALFESAIPLTQLATGVSYTESTHTLSNMNTWASKVATGSVVTVDGSTKGSNGRVTLYDVTGSTIVVGRRAVNAWTYSPRVVAGVCEMHFKEDREHQNLYWRIVNRTAGTVTITASLGITGATLAGVTMVQGAWTGGSYSTSGVTSAVWAVAAGGTIEALLHLSKLDATTVFQPSIASGTVSAVLLGEAALHRRTNGEAVDTTSMPPWKGGGLIRGSLSSGQDETGLTVYDQITPGWHLTMGSPAGVEEELYMVASPDDYVVVEVAHANHANYTDDALASIVTTTLLPAGTDAILGIV